ncbi:hypothetical protein H9P43_005882 [Blastocladiella emersonii ATCC 22665]|nr:hypothetical protein H9P43_005882 [Blastocladiella emersonii ATCC 22665]
MPDHHPRPVTYPTGQQLRGATTALPSHQMPYMQQRKLAPATASPLAPHFITPTTTSTNAAAAAAAAAAGAPALTIAIPGFPRMRVLRQGWLYKRGPFYQPWRMRWCVIAQPEDGAGTPDQSGARGPVLVIYTQRDHANIAPPKGQVPLAVRMEIEVPMQPVKKNLLDRTALYPFVLIVHGRKHVFASHHRKDREDWIHLIQSLSDSPTAQGPAGITVVHELDDCSVLESTSVVDHSSAYGNDSVVSATATSAMTTTSTTAITSSSTMPSSTVMSLGISRLDALSICGTEILTDAELSEMGRPERITSRPASPVAQSAPPATMTPADPWNELYQRLCDQPCATPQAQIQKDLQICDLLGQFREVALTLATQVVDEYHTRPSTGNGAAPTESWVFGNVVVAMAADYAACDRGAVLAAMRRATHELQGVSAIASVASDLHTPLMCVVDYKGFRLVCSAAVPLNATSTLVLDLSTGRADVSALEKLSEAFAPLRLREHPVSVMPAAGTGHAPTTVAVRGSASVHVHYARAHDHYYATRLADLFPVDQSKHGKPVDARRRLRPEFVAQYKHALSSDAYAPAAPGWRCAETHPETAAGERDAVYAARFLRENHIPAFVARLDALELIPADSVGLAACLHAAGINVRYLGLIATRTRLPAVKELCLVEMVGRAAKEVFGEKLRSSVLHFRRIGATKIDHELVRIATEFVNHVVTANEKVWEETLKPAIQRKFSFVMSIDIFRALQRPAVFLSLQHHCALDLADSDHYDWTSPSPVTERDFSGFAPKCKTLSPATLGAKHLTTPSERATYELARHLALRGPRAKLAPCPVTARRLLAVSRCALSGGKPADAVSYANAAMQVARRHSGLAARAWLALAEATLRQRNGGEDEGVSGGHAPPRGQDSNETLVGAPAPSAKGGKGPQPSNKSVAELATAAASAIAWHWGPDHPLSIELHSRMARAWATAPPAPSTKSTSGAPPATQARSLDHHARALRASVRSLGRTHPVTARLQLAAALQLLTGPGASRRVHEAQRMVADALAALGGNHNPAATWAKERALAHVLLAECAAISGDMASARAHAAQARGLREKEYGYNHVLTADACAQVAALAVAAAALSTSPESGAGAAATAAGSESSSLADAADAPPPVVAGNDLVTPQAKADVAVALEAYTRVFKYHKWRAAAAAKAAARTGSSAAMLATSSAVSTATDETAVAPTSTSEPTTPTFAGDADEAATVAHAELAAADDPLAYVRHRAVVAPPGPPNAALLALARTLVALKLRVLPPHHQGHVRSARQKVARSGAAGTGDAMRDVMARLVGLTPAVFVDECLVRADDGDGEAVEELAVVVQLVDRSG